MQSMLHWSTSSPTPLSHKLLLSHLLSWVGTLILFYKLHLSIFVIEICQKHFESVSDCPLNKILHGVYIFESKQVAERKTNNNVFH